MLTVKVGHYSTIDFISPVPGERPRLTVLTGAFQTEWMFPEGMEVLDAFSSVVGSMPAHVDLSERNQIAWIESNSDQLRKSLTTHFSPVMKKRPASWGMTNTNTTTTTEDEEETESE